MKYFENITTIEQLKKEYKKLCFRFHPDLNGGDNKPMQEINSEYEFLLKNLATEFNTDPDKDFTYNWENDQFADIIQKIITFKIDIEIIGSWIWCFNSFEYKDILKELGFWFSKSKKAWVYSGSAKSRSRGRYSMNDLREKWGSEKVETKTNYLS